MVTNPPITNWKIYGWMRHNILGKEFIFVALLQSVDELLTKMYGGGESRKCSPPVQIGLKITLTDLVADHTRIAAFNEDLNTKHCATARKQESSEEPQSSRTERSGWVLLPGNCLPGIKLQVYGCRLQWFWPPGCGCAVYYPYGGGTALPQSEGTLFVFVSVLVYFAILKTEVRLPVYLRFRPHLSLPGQ